MVLNTLKTHQSGELYQNRQTARISPTKKIYINAMIMGSDGNTEKYKPKSSDKARQGFVSEGFYFMVLPDWTVIIGYTIRLGG